MGTSINLENGNFKVYMNSESLNRVDGKTKEYLKGNPIEITWEAILNQLPNLLKSEQPSFQFDASMDLTIDNDLDNIPVLVKAKRVEGTGRSNWYLDLTGVIDPQAFHLNNEDFTFEGNLDFKISLMLISMLER